jgi:hypothetical protein
MSKNNKGYNRCGVLKTIDVSDVPNLYKRLGIDFVRGSFGCPLKERGYHGCGCLLTALLCEKIGKRQANHLIRKRHTMNTFLEEAADILELDQQYVTGLVHGFDGWRSEGDTVHGLGKRHGAEAFELLTKSNIENAVYNN